MYKSHYCTLHSAQAPLYAPVKIDYRKIHRQNHTGSAKSKVLSVRKGLLQNLLTICTSLEEGSQLVSRYGRPRGTGLEVVICIAFGNLIYLELAS